MRQKRKNVKYERKKYKIIQQQQQQQSNVLCMLSAHSNVHGIKRLLSIYCTRTCSEIQ